MAEWTLDEVAERFREAAETAHRLPKVGVQGYFNTWPAIKREARELYTDPDRVLRFPPTPEDIALPARFGLAVALHAQGTGLIDALKPVTRPPLLPAISPLQPEKADAVARLS